MLDDKWGFRVPMCVLVFCILAAAPGFVIGHTEWQLMINEWLGVR